jgi:hypothetical protein
MITIDSALNEIMQLDFQSREMLIEILQKRQIEDRRTKINDSAKQSLKDYQDGKIKPMSAADTLKKLDSL